MDYCVADTPTEGKVFLVKPLWIDRTKFEKPRRNQDQECTRDIIMDAFDAVDSNPEKYASSFYTFIPKVPYGQDFQSFEGLKQKAQYYDRGGQMADLVEQALEWAQRISNGECWEAICNYQDTVRYNRVIQSSDGRLGWVVGGSSRFEDGLSPSHLGESFYGVTRDCTVPLVVFRK